MESKQNLYCSRVHKDHRKEKNCLRTFTKRWNRAHYLPTVKFTSTRMTTIFMSKLAKRNSEMTKTTFTIYLANNQSG